MPTFAIAVGVRTGRIPVNWTVRDCSEPEVQDTNGRGVSKARVERVFWPEVQTAGATLDTEVDEIDAPDDIRTLLFQALGKGWVESTVLAILNRVGAWSVAPMERTEPFQKGRECLVIYRHRAEHLVVQAISSEDMKREVEHWYSLVGASKATDAKRKKAYREPPQSIATPAGRHAYAWETKFLNTQSISLEWAGRDPRAVIETVCATELLAALAWADVAGLVPSYVCQRCHTRFSSARKRKYCRWEYGHAEAVKNYKQRKAGPK